jgi:hypothetical protein
MVLGSDATPIDVAMEATGGFGSLKAVLGAIPAVYSNREVRFRPPHSEHFAERICRNSPPSETI